MSTNDKKRFVQCFNRLAVALQLPADKGDTAMQKIYWDALAALPVEAVEDAERWFTVNAKWFPKTSEWIERADLARAARALAAALPAPREEPWKSECETCDDAGFEYIDCQGNDQCGRRFPHAKHKYVIKCICRSTNRTYQRKVEETRQQATRRKAAS